MSDLSSSYVDLISSTTIDLYNTLFSRLSEMEQAQERHARQQAEVSFIEGAGQELRDAALEGLQRQKLKLQSTERALDVYDLSINVVAGAILQIAKQGIAIRHGSRDACPEGRAILGTCARELIWHGRNQAMHYEDTKPSSTWISLFTSLSEKLPGRFSIEAPFMSRAKDVFDLLGWECYEQYEADMRQLCSE